MRSQSDRYHSFRSDRSWSLLLTPAVQGGNHSDLASNSKDKSTIKRSIMLHASMAERTVGSLCGVAPMKREHLATGRQNGLAWVFKFRSCAAMPASTGPQPGSFMGLSDYKNITGSCNLWKIRLYCYSTKVACDIRRNGRSGWNKYGWKSSRESRQR